MVFVPRLDGYNDWNEFSLSNKAINKCYIFIAYSLYLFIYLLHNSEAKIMVKKMGFSTLLFQMENLINKYFPEVERSLYLSIGGISPENRSSKIQK